MSLTGSQTILCNTLKGADEAAALAAIEAIDDVNFFDADRNMPLHLACVKPWSKVVQALLDKGALSVKAWGGKTALHLAQDNDLLEVAECLVSHYPHLRTAGDLQGRTPLHEAAAQNKLAFMNLYLTLKIKDVTVKCDVNVRDSRNSTALHEAVKKGHVEAVRMLLAHDANPELCDDGACKAVVYAGFPRNDEILALLAPKAPTLFSLAALHVIEDYAPPAEDSPLHDVFLAANTLVTFQRENARQQAEAAAKVERARAAARQMIEDAPKFKALEEGFAKLALGFNS